MPEPRPVTYLQWLAARVARARAMARALSSSLYTGAGSRVEYLPASTTASTRSTCLSFAWARADYSKAQASLRVPEPPWRPADQVLDTRLGDLGGPPPWERGETAAPRPGAPLAVALEAARVNGAGEPSASFAVALSQVTLSRTGPCHERGFVVHVNVAFSSKRKKLLEQCTV